MGPAAHGPERKKNEVLDKNQSEGSYAALLGGRTALRDFSPQVPTHKNPCEEPGVPSSARHLPTSWAGRRGSWLRGAAPGTPLTTRAPSRWPQGSAQPQAAQPDEGPAEARPSRGPHRPGNREALGSTPGPRAPPGRLRDPGLPAPATAPVPPPGAAHRPPGSVSSRRRLAATRRCSGGRAARGGGWRRPHVVGSGSRGGGAASPRLASLRLLRGQLGQGSSAPCGGRLCGGAGKVSGVSG